MGIGLLGIGPLGVRPCAAASSPLEAGSEPKANPEFKAEVKYAQVGDVRLAYYVRGEGKPLVMINGFISTMSLWDPLLIEDLAKHRQLILFDNRGVGLSTDTKENATTIPQMADDAAGSSRRSASKSRHPRLVDGRGSPSNC